MKSAKRNDYLDVTYLMIEETQVEDRESKWKLTPGTVAKWKK